jgi:hypothetical protein
MISVEIATVSALRHIAQNLREIDRVELSCTSPTDNPAEYLPDRIFAYAKWAFVTRDENRVALTAWGLVPMYPGVGAAFAFGTADWGRALWTMTRHVRRVMIPLVLDHGYHRIECRALASRDDVSRWIALFGAEREAVLRSSGKRGEDFVLYRWLSDERRRSKAEDLPAN